MQCEKWDDANSQLFKEFLDEAVHKNSYKRKLYELISASLSLMGHRPKGCGGALRAQFISFLRRPDCFARKTVQPRLRRDGNAPLLSPAATSPPEGEILAALIFEFLMRTKDEWQEDFPLRGKWCVSTKRGAFLRAKPGCTVFPAAKGGFKSSPLNQPALWAEPIGQCGST